jgi:hypothetical protein
LDYKLTASRNSFCDGLDLLVQWTAPINHTEFDSVVFFSKTNNSIIDQCVAAGRAVFYLMWLLLCRMCWGCAMLTRFLQIFPSSSSVSRRSRIDLFKDIP